MAKKKTATKKKIPKNLKIYDPRLACIPSDGVGRTRHITTSQRAGKPLCDEYGWSWTASKSKKVHARPICKKCMKIVETLHESLMKDPGRVDVDELFESSRKQFEALLKEYD